jgi:hypothetical protein
MPHMSHLTFYTLTEFNFDFHSSLATAFNEPDIETPGVPSYSLISIPHCPRRSKLCVQLRYHRNIS